MLMVYKFYTGLRSSWPYSNMSLWCSSFFHLDLMMTFHVGKRMGEQKHWEPFYIGTHADPPFDERFTYEGRSNKMPQACWTHFESESNPARVNHPGKDFRQSACLSLVKRLLIMAITHVVIA